MQRKTKIVMGAGIVGVVALGGLAGMAAADRGHGWGQGWEGHGGMGHGRMMMRNMLERYDANGDGKLTEDEIDGARAASYGEFDADKNGNLSLQEFQGLWLKDHQQRIVRSFQRLDRNGDGQVTVDEYKRPMADLVADMDQNGDGALNRDDHPRGGMGGPGMMHRRHMGMGMGMGDIEPETGPDNDAQ